MDIQQLRYFVEIARQRSFTKASASLHVSQPALSKTVKNLEAEIGAEIFDRKSKTIALTDCGESLFEAARQAIRQFDAVTESLNDIKMLKRGKLAVGIPPVIGTTYFAPIITGFKQSFPGIDLQIVEEGARTILTRVIEDQVNIGIIIAPADPEELDIIPVMSDENVVVVNELNPLARKRHVGFKDLAGEAFYIFNESFMLHGQIVAKCREAGFEPRIPMTSSQWDFLMELVSLNQGITVLPRPIAAKGKYANIKILPIVPAFPWEIILITRKEKYLSFAVREFIGCVKSWFSQVKSP